MRTVCLILITALGSGLRSQASLHTENAALRHQLAVLQRQARGRPRLRPGDRLFWAWLSRLWPGWRHALVIVKPDTVLRWHRRGFRLTAVEESVAWTRAAPHPARRSSAHPPDVLRQPDLGVPRASTASC